MRIARVLLLFMVGPYLVPELFAENLRLHGIVMDKVSHAFVGGATVSASGQQAANDAVTDSEGVFRLTLREGIGLGDIVRIRVSKTGYEPYDREEAASPEKTLEIFLQPIGPSGKHPKPVPGPSMSLAPPPKDFSHALRLTASFWPDHQDGVKLFGISWRDVFTDVRLLVENGSERDLENLELTISLDTDVAGISQSTNLPDTDYRPLQLMIPGVVEGTLSYQQGGKPVEEPFGAGALAFRAYRVSCKRLARGDPLELVIATAALKAETSVMGGRNVTITSIDQFSKERRRPRLIDVDGHYEVTTEDGKHPRYPVNFRHEFNLPKPEDRALPVGKSVPPTFTASDLNSHPDRRILSDDQVNWVSELSRFPNENVWIIANPENSEVKNLGDELQNIFRRAKWFPMILPFREKNDWNLSTKYPQRGIVLIVPSRNAETATLSSLFEKSMMRVTVEENPGMKRTDGVAFLMNSKPFDGIIVAIGDNY